MTIANKNFTIRYFSNSDFATDQPIPLVEAVTTKFFISQSHLHFSHTVL